MKPIRPVLLLALIFLTQCVFGQTNNEKITEAFFKTYEESPAKAYENLLSGNKWMRNKKIDIETGKTQLANFLNGLGEYLGYETITEKSVGESYVLKSYLIKYERQPIRFSFLLYKPKDTWQIQNFAYDTNIEDELEEAAKIYRLKSNW